MDEMSMVRRILAEPPPPAHVVAAGRERLIRSTVRVAATTRTRRRPAALGALALGLTSAAAVAALAVTALVPGAGTSSGSGGPALADGSARSVLLAAAVRAEAAPSSGTYWHLRWMSKSTVTLGHAPNRYRMEEVWVHEKWAERNGQAWIGDRKWVRPKTAQDQAAWRRDGAPSKWCNQPQTVNMGDTCVRIAPGTASLRKDYFPFEVSEGLDKLTFAQLQRLPQDSQALHAWLVADARRHLDPSVGADVVNTNIADELAGLIEDVPVPPGVRAAAYRALASMPNVTSAGAAQDELGRRGVRIVIAEGKGWDAGSGGGSLRCHNGSTAPQRHRRRSSPTS